MPALRQRGDAFDARIVERGLGAVGIDAGALFALL
jgi:hypothetical protein